MTEPEVKQTILIIDDVPDNIDVLKGILSSSYKVRAATSGEKGLAIAEKHKPDLILLDIQMPGIDGYEVCERLKISDETKDIPVIFVTAHDEVEDETHGFKLGAVDYITKPVYPELVLARVEAHLALYERTCKLKNEINIHVGELEKLRDIKDLLVGLVATLEPILKGLETRGKDKVELKSVPGLTIFDLQLGRLKQLLATNDPEAVHSFDALHAKLVTSFGKEMVDDVASYIEQHEYKSALALLNAVTKA